MAVNWALGLQGGNAGEAFTKSFQQGQEIGRQNRARAAMSALVKDPSNLGAMSALADADPATAMKFREQQAEIAKTQHGEWVKMAAHAAKMADTPEKWDMAVDQFVQMGHKDAGRLKGQFSPALRMAFMAQGGLNDEQADPGIIREFQIATERGLVPQGTSYQQYLQMRNPGMLSPVTIPENATVETPGMGGDMPTISSPDEAASLPPGTQFRMPDGRIGTVPGGQTGSAPSGGFL